jgi:hypothetical protein
LIVGALCHELMLSQCQYDASYHADNEPMVQSNTVAWALTTLV